MRCSVVRALMLGLVVVLVVALGVGSFAPRPVSGAADKLRFVWFTDGAGDQQGIEAAIQQFNATNSDIEVELSIIPYAQETQLLVTQAEARQAPDLARVDENFRFPQYMLDLRPYLQDKNFAKQFLTEAMTVTTGLNGEIYGIPHDFTVDGPFVNLSLVKKAGLKLPEGSRVSWNTWLDLAIKVKNATGVPYAFAADRSGNRLDGFVQAWGGGYYTSDGKRARINDAINVKAVSKFVQLHKDGVMPLEIWAGSGTGYVSGAQTFVTGRVVLYLSGNWSVARFANTIGDKFEYTAIPDPCEVQCSGMPGGKFIVAFKDTKHPQQVARFIEYLGSKEAMAKFVTRALFLPTRQDLIQSGVDYAIRGNDMNVFIRDIPRLTKTSYIDDYAREGGAVADVVADRVTQAIIGQMTVQQALDLAQKKATELISK